MLSDYNIILMFSAG